MSQRGRAWMAVLSVGLQLAVLYVPRAPTVAAGGLPLDKLVHLLVFALPTFALIRAGVPRGWVIALMALQAPLSEVIQGWLLAERSGDPRDVVADLVGVALGAWLASRTDRHTSIGEGAHAESGSAPAVASGD